MELGKDITILGMWRRYYEGSKRDKNALSYLKVWPYKDNPAVNS
jgi:hypothetical protein